MKWKIKLFEKFYRGSIWIEMSRETYLISARIFLFAHRFRERQSRRQPKTFVPTERICTRCPRTRFPLRAARTPRRRHQRPRNPLWYSTGCPIRPFPSLSLCGRFHSDSLRLHVAKVSRRNSFENYLWSISPPASIETRDWTDLPSWRSCWLLVKFENLRIRFISVGLLYYS